MRRNPERVAWIVILLAFAAFCSIVVAVPLGIRWYSLNAQKDHEALVESLGGTVVIEPPVGRGPVPLSTGQSMSVGEGTVIRADESSEAVITFFDHSPMRLSSSSTVKLESMRAPRYSPSQLPNVIRVQLLGGGIYLGTALSLDSPLDFRVTTLHAESILAADGGFAIVASNDRSEIMAYRGRAVVVANGEALELQGRQRTEVVLGRAPSPVTGVARDLVTNGDFFQPLSEGWLVFNDQGTDGGDVDGEIEVIVDEGHRAVRVWRTGGQGNHCETVLEQAINQQLPDPATSLTVRATVKIEDQSLSGGGYLSSEYPVMIRLVYRDVYDSEAEWVQGFYYQNLAGNPTMYGLQIPRGRWYLFESENLLETLPVRPFKIVKVRVYAAGWDYESLVSRINVVVE